MSTDEIIASNTERFSGWQDTLSRNHATAAFALGVGHDHQSGTLHLLCVCDLQDEEIIAFLAFALDQLRAKAALTAAFARG